MKLRPGLYDQLVTQQVNEGIKQLDGCKALVEELDQADGSQYLTRLLARELGVELKAMDGTEQLAQVNNLLQRDPISPPARLLKAIYSGVHPPQPPTTPLSQSGLIMNAKGEPRLGFELEREMETADEVWMLVSFIKWRGWQRLRHAMEALERAGKRVRVLTTTYMGASDYKALEAMAGLSNVRMKISLDGTQRRLHAKAWLFVRESGFSSAYVGSANLSGPALEDGIEWTVKLSEVETPHVIEKFRGAFESQWNSGEFVSFTPDIDSMAKEVKAALQAGRKPQSRHSYYFDLKPHAYQQATLDELEAKRLDLGQKRNLVVAPTGTGKTMIAAFDYARQPGRKRRLLFLAHREELLRQARDAFRQVLRDESFGQLMAGGEAPSSYEFLFATVQSVASRQLIDQMGKTYWQYVVLDEAHHTTAASYRSIIDRLQPDLLLGLTATPERMDGESILPFFGGSIADEMRLWHAIERQYLVPFDYYGVFDGTDLSELNWSKGRYELAGLRQMLSWNERRAQVVIRQFEEIHGNIHEARAIGFCVSIEHAEFMAEMFRKAGFKAEAVTSATEDDLRRTAPQRLTELQVNVLLTVDLFNEGIDIPAADTILFLRPTESATVFLQQLGRGLRLAKDKQSCLVLDFIGNQRREFRFDLRFKAMFGGTRQQVKQQLETGVTRLPGNCYFRLDEQSRFEVLRNLKAGLETRRSRMVEETRSLSEALGRRPTLKEFLDETQYELSDIYKDSVAGWTGLLRDANWLQSEAGVEDLLLSRQLKFLLHWDAIRQLGFCGALRPASSEPERRMSLMLTHRLLQGRAAGRAVGPESGMRALLGSVAVRREFQELISVLREKVKVHREEQFCREDWPLIVHRSYTRDEILTGVGYKTFGRRIMAQEGVLWLPQEKTELLFVTLDKTEKRFSPTTRYADYALSPLLFHWQSQSTTSEASKAGIRYVSQRKEGTRILLFVRENSEAPYAFLGDVHYVSHHGERPMNVVWELKEAIPPALFEVCASFQAA